MAIVVAFETLKLCTPTLDVLTDWLETVMFVLLARDALLENPVRTCVCAVGCVTVGCVAAVLCCVWLERAVIALESLEDVYRTISQDFH